MLLIDSLHINNSGGLVLLKYLIEYLKKSNLEIFYLLDKRTESIFIDIPEDQRKFLFPSIKERLKFYLLNKGKYSKILCFGNLPPPIRTDAQVFIYFHQSLFLEFPTGFSFRNKLIYIAKQQFINFTKTNADLWLLQSSLMKEKLAHKYNLSQDNIKVLAFYPPFELTKSMKQNTYRKQNSFLYVSNVTPHKNHERLIEAFCLAYEEIEKGELILTVPPHAGSICKLIKQKQAQGYPISNIGFIDKDKLTEHYLSAEYLIFPSLTESFGLGLIEGIDLGCKVLGADLPYTYQVCEPSLTFDAFSIDSIKKAIITASSQDLPVSKKIINNDINTLLKMLEN